MSTTDPLRAHHVALHAEATRLAGGLNDLAQRATVYHHLFAHSGRNHVFPLIAAHGALWARGYFRFGMRLGRLASWQYLSAAARARQLEALARFADAFRDVNRRVCIDTYAKYHFTRRYGLDPGAVRFVPEPLLTALCAMHAARRNGRELSALDKRRVFEAFFLNEQETVVGPALEQAASDLDWPLIKAIALRPRIRFAYFPAREAFWFRNFADRAERVRRGLNAFEIALDVGLRHVEASFSRYAILPPEFHVQPAAHFRQMRHAVLAAA